MVKEIWLFLLENFVFGKNNQILKTKTNAVKTKKSFLTIIGMIIIIMPFFFSSCEKKDEGFPDDRITTHDTVDKNHQIHILINKGVTVSGQLVHNNYTGAIYEDSVCPFKRIEVLNGHFSRLCKAKVDSTTWEVIPYEKIIIAPHVPVGTVVDIVQ
jgi:hypothetical protein